MSAYMYNPESNLCKLFKLNVPNNKWMQIGLGFTGIKSGKNQKEFIEFLHKDPSKNPFSFEIIEDADFEHEDSRIISFYSFTQKNDFALSYECFPACDR